MNLKWFGLVAFIGLGGWWLFNRDSLHIRAAEPRTLTASWYGAECEGKLMANGKPFDPLKYTCASREYKLGEMLGVTYAGKTVAVVVTDVGPARKYLATRQLDLSRAAFAALAPLSKGLIDVTVTVLPLK